MKRFLKSKGDVKLTITALSFLMALVLYFQPVTRYQKNILNTSNKATRDALQRYYMKFSRHIPPDKDINCVSTIPETFLEPSTDSPIHIPRKKALLNQTFDVLKCMYHRYVQTLQRHCSRPTRVGSLGLGGWTVCTDPGAAPKKPCIVYSFSLYRYHQNYSTFVYEMKQEYGCKVEMYSIKGDVGAEELIYHNLNTNDIIHYNITYLNKIFTDSTKSVVTVLAMDIFAREWEIISTMLKTGALRHVEQLSVKLHSKVNRATPEDYVRQLVVLRQLYNAGFRIFWTHRDETCLNPKLKLTGCYHVNMIRVTSRPDPLLIPEDKELFKMTLNECGEFFFRYVSSSSIQISCKEIIRIGKITDGGWNVCHDAEFTPRNSCRVYSFGINNDFSFDDDVANTYGCNVESFDPSMQKSDHRHSKKVMFYALGISNKNTEISRRGLVWQMRTLGNIMDALNDTENIIDILKIDVEASEWVSIPQMLSSGAMKYVRQFSFELHVGKPEDDAKVYQKALMLLRDLYNFGFRIHWININMRSIFITEAGKERAACYEVYLININNYF